MIKLLVNNLYTKIDGEFSIYDILPVLSRTQKFYIRKKGKKYGEYKKRDIILFNNKDNKFPTGFLKQIISIYKDKELEIIDFRKPKYILPYPETDIVLRPYQDAAILPINNNYRGVIHHSVGAGKTILAAKMVEMFQSNTLYIVPNLELLDQTYRKFCSFFPEKYVGVVGEGKFSPSNITIATAQTLWSILGTDKFISLIDDIDLVFIDEVHRISETTYFRIVNTWYHIVMSISSTRVYGLTATPGDDKSIQRFLINAAVGDTIHRVSSKHLIDEGYLVQPYIFFISNEISFPDWGRMDWKKAKLEGIMGNGVRNNYIKEIAEFHAKRGDTVLVIVDEIENHGKLLESLIDGSIFLHGNTIKKERVSIRNKFREDNIPILITTLMGEGVDYSNIDIIILAVGGKTERGFYQRIGRSMRVEDGKEFSIVYDFYDEDNSILEKHSSLRREYAEAEEGYKLSIISIDKWRDTFCE